MENYIHHIPSEEIQMKLIELVSNAGKEDQRNMV